MMDELGFVPTPSSGDERLSFDRAELDRGIPARFRFVVGQVPPSHLALVGAKERLTYADLDAASSRLAAELSDLAGSAVSNQTQKPVALLMPQGAYSLIGIVGTLKAGHFYVPLDLSMGDATLAHILNDSAPCALVTTREVRDAVRALVPPDQALPLVCVDELPARATTAGPDMAWVTGRSLLNLQYTSGSTGQPRGVMRTQAQQLIAVYVARNEQGYAPTDRVTHLLSYAYAFSSTPLFGGLLNGATLYAGDLREMPPSILYEWLAHERITKLQVSVGTLRGLADLANQRPPLADLRAVTTGGEAMSRGEVERLSALLPLGCKLTVRLASTEAGTYARFSIRVGTPWHGERTPAGYVPDDAQVLILDESGQPVPPGTVGQIAVRSRFMSAGYWRQPERTAEKYLPDPDGGDCPIFLTGDLGRLSADGLLEHLGRMDFMVKIRGYRVEPEAIEAALATHPAVRECTVVVRTAPDGEARLVAYWASRQTPAPTTSELRGWLARSLPEYMIPARFAQLDALPRIPNGKVDRRALPAPGRARPDLDTPYVPPRTEIEARLAAIWGEALELDAVGADDDFMELGGDSLSALHMMLLVEEQLGLAVPSEFYRRPTLANLGSLVGGTSEASGARSDAPQPRNQVEPDDLVGDDGTRPRERESARAVLRAAVIHRGPVVGRVGLPYGLGVGLQRAWLSAPGVRQVLLQRRVDLFARCRSDAGLADPRGELLTLNLMANTWRRWRALALQRPATFRKHVRVQGMDVVREAVDSGRGVLIVFLHQACGIALGKVPLRALGRERIYTLANVQGVVGPAATPIIMERTHHALAELVSGGTVFVAGDGRMGSGGWKVPFHGRELPLRRGFAELALRSQAVVMTLFSFMSVDGDVTLEFSPLATPKTHTEADELIHLYAGMLRERWTRLLPSSFWGWLEYLQSLPRTG